jgi:hypothetical protein
MSRKPNNLSGAVYGRLTVVGDSGLRAGDGSVIWGCICKCGKPHRAVASNLRNGSVTSCGCFAREQSAERRRNAAKPAAICKVESCVNDVSKGGHGYCGLHAQRVRRYGDAFYVTPKEEQRKRNREAQLATVESIKPSTYRKYLGRHEHRVVAEQKIGRPIQPGEHVHHIDGDKHNNNPDNLIVLTASEHQRLHAMERKNG